MLLPPPPGVTPYPREGRRLAGLDRSAPPQLVVVLHYNAAAPQAHRKVWNQGRVDKRPTIIVEMLGFVTSPVAMPQPPMHQLSSH